MSVFCHFRQLAILGALFSCGPVVNVVPVTGTFLSSAVLRGASTNAPGLNPKSFRSRLDVGTVLATYNAATIKKVISSSFTGIVHEARQKLLKFFEERMHRDSASVFNFARAMRSSAARLAAHELSLEQATLEVLDFAERFISHELKPSLTEWCKASGPSDDIIDELTKALIADGLKTIAASADTPDMQDFWFHLVMSIDDEPAHDDEDECSTAADFSTDETNVGADPHMTSIPASEPETIQPEFPDSGIESNTSFCSDMDAIDFEAVKAETSVAVTEYLQGIKFENWPVYFNDINMLQLYSRLVNNDRGHATAAAAALEQRLDPHIIAVVEILQARFPGQARVFLDEDIVEAIRGGLMEHVESTNLTLSRNEQVRKAAQEIIDWSVATNPQAFRAEIKTLYVYLNAQEKFPFRSASWLNIKTAIESKLKPYVRAVAERMKANDSYDAEIQEIILQVISERFPFTNAAATSSNQAPITATSSTSRVCADRTRQYAMVGHTNEESLAYRTYLLDTRIAATQFQNYQVSYEGAIESVIESPAFVNSTLRPVLEKFEPSAKKVDEIIKKLVSEDIRNAKPFDRVWRQPLP